MISSCKGSLLYLACHLSFHCACLYHSITVPDSPFFSLNASCADLTVYFVLEIRSIANQKFCEFSKTPFIFCTARTCTMSYMPRGTSPTRLLKCSNSDRFYPSLPTMVQFCSYLALQKSGEMFRTQYVVFIDGVSMFVDSGFENAGNSLSGVWF